MLFLILCVLQTEFVYQEPLEHFTLMDGKNLLAILQFSKQVDFFALLRARCIAILIWVHSIVIQIEIIALLKSRTKKCLNGLSH